MFIFVYGVVQSFIVYEEGGKYLVFVGGCWFCGLDLLWKCKVILVIFFVFVIIRDKVEVVEFLLIENEQCEDMYFVDRVWVFVSLCDEGGLGVEDIVVCFIYSVGYVVQLFWFGSFVLEIFDVFVVDQIGMDVVKVLIICDDYVVQIVIYEWCGNNVNVIWCVFIVEKIGMDFVVFWFVGEEVYEVVGGIIMVDLFGKYGYVDYLEFFDELVWGKLDVIKVELKVEGWYLVEVVDEVLYDIYSCFFICLMI